MKKYKTSIFWFRQDLRIEDNTGFYHAIELSEKVLTIFIFDKNILDTFPQKDKRTGFIFEVIEDLQKKISNLGGSLYIEYGDPFEIIAGISEDLGIQAIFTNKSYGNYGIQRDSKIRGFCYENKINFNSYEDFLLVEPENIKKYKVFTPYFKTWSNIEKKEPNNAPIKILSPAHPQNNISKIKDKVNPGENNFRKIDFAKKRLEEFDFNNYEKNRNIPSMDGSSRLSAYIRFGLISIREIYNYLKNNSSLGAKVFISELAWRDFWHHIAYHFPENKYREFQEKRRGIKWENNMKFLEAWKNGKTGYPIIDAAMIQLKKENWMHNRMRMVVASFLTKDLLIDWRLGEKHFKDYLIDYDENVNIGNWQWAASVGADPKPLRIFSPILQSKRFDPKAEYIKKYIPALENQNIKAIHNPLLYKLEYYTPIVDHSVNSKIFKEKYYNN